MTDAYDQDNAREQALCDLAEDAEDAGMEPGEYRAMLEEERAESIRDQQLYDQQLYDHQH